MYVIKRDKGKQRVMFDKITDRMMKLCWGLDNIDVTIITAEIATRLYKGITTVELDELSAETAAALTIKHPNYGVLAARICVSNLHKKTEESFSLVMSKLYDAGIVTDEFWKVVKKNSIRLDGAIDHSRSYDVTYFGFKTLERNYLTKIGEKIVERPQHMWMRVAVAVNLHDVDAALHTYELMSQKYFTHATPTLLNAGTVNGQLASCFLMSIDSNKNTIGDVFNAVKQSALITNMCGGIGINVTNAPNPDTLVSLLKLFNETCRYSANGEKRRGGYAVYVEPWHPKIVDFLDAKKNTGGAEELRARDLFYALWTPDLFMKRVSEDGGSWCLMDPTVCTGLSDVWGDEFETLYTKYEREGKYVSKMPARTLWESICKSMSETGTPYILFKDVCNRKSNQRNLGTIKSSNLCVASETKILTNEGQQIIADLKDKRVKVWNGEGFSEVIVCQTGSSQKLLTVRTKRGCTLRCTPYHKFWIIGRKEPIEAQHLEPGMKLIRQKSLPVINEGQQQTMKYAYTHGFFCTDGTTQSKKEKIVTRCKYRAKLNGLCMSHQLNTKDYEEDGTCCASTYTQQKYVDLYHEKRALLKYINYDYANTYDKRIRLRLPKDIEKKFVVPLNYSLQSKLEWLAGYMDGDGCTIKSSQSTNIQISSIHFNFLNEIMLMLQTMGVNSCVRPVRPTQFMDMPGGRYLCKKTWRLLIAGKGVRTLKKLGLQTNRLDLTFGPNPVNIPSRCDTIECVEDLDETADTYCFNEPLKHRGVFNGILTSQCSEIIQYSSSDEIAVCNLASIALNKFVKGDKGDEYFDFDELKKVTKIIVNNLNNVIDISTYPVPEAKISNMNHRPIGIGVQGLADAFMLMGYPFTSDEARKLNKNIFESIYYAALEKSCEMAKETGSSYESFKGSPASKGKLQFDLWNDFDESKLMNDWS